MAKEDKINFLNERRNYLQFVRLDGQSRLNENSCESNSLTSKSSSNDGSTQQASSSNLSNSLYPGTSFKLVQYPPDLISTNISQNGSCSDQTAISSDLSNSVSRINRLTRHSNSDSNATDNDSLLSENSFVENALFTCKSNGTQRKSQRRKSFSCKEVQCDSIVVSFDVDCQADLDPNELYLKLRDEHARTKKQLDSMSYVVEGMVRERSTLFLRMHEMSKKLALVDEQQRLHFQDMEKIQIQELEVASLNEQRQLYIEELERFKILMDEKTNELEQTKSQLQVTIGNVKDLIRQKQELENILQSQKQKCDTTESDLTRFQEQHVKEISTIDEQRIEIESLNEKTVALQRMCSDLELKLRDEEQQKAHLNGEIETTFNQNERLGARLEELVVKVRDKEQFLIRQLCIWEQQIRHFFNSFDTSTLKVSPDTNHGEESLLADHCSRFWNNLIESVLSQQKVIERLQCELSSVNESAGSDSETQVTGDKPQLKAICEMVGCQTQTEMNFEEVFIKIVNSQQEIDRLRTLLSDKDAQIESLQQQKAQQDELKNAEIDRLNHRLTDLIASFESRTQEFEKCRLTLEDRLNNDQQQIRIEKQDQILIRQDLETIKTALLESNRLLQMRNDQNNQLQRKVIELEMERNRLSEEARDVNQQLEELRLENGQFKQSLESGQESALSQCACLQLSLKERDELIEQLTNEIDGLKKKIKFLNEKHVEEIQIMKKESSILTHKNSELDCENAKLNMRLCELRQVIRNNLEQTKQLRNQIKNNRNTPTTSFLHSTRSSPDKGDSGSEATSCFPDDSKTSKMNELVNSIKERIRSKKHFL